MVAMQCVVPEKSILSPSRIVHCEPLLLLLPPTPFGSQINKSNNYNKIMILDHILFPAFNLHCSYKWTPNIFQTKAKLCGEVIITFYRDEKLYMYYYLPQSCTGNCHLQILCHSEASRKNKSIMLRHIKLRKRRDLPPGYSCRLSQDIPDRTYM